MGRSSEYGGGFGHSTEYRPHLDGLRGLSILTVVAVHAGLPDIRANSAGAAFVGVNTFFVLSGFLITGLLLEEWEQRGSISVAYFYTRRALRLLPALGTLLAAFVVGAWFLSSPANARATAWDAVPPALYIANWTRALGLGRPVLFGHTWSLSIEEQFYLVWPLTLILLLRLVGSRRGLVPWLVLGVFLIMVERTLLVTAGATRERIFNGTDTRADALLMGCLLAVITVHTRKTPAVRFIGGALAWVSFGLLTYFCFRRDFNQPFAQIVLYPLSSVCAGLIIFELESAPTGLLARGFGQPWLVYVGKVSYGLYLWHAPIIQVVFGRGWSRPVELSIAGVLTVAATLISYYLVERPLLQFKRRFSLLSGRSTAGAICAPT